MADRNRAAKKRLELSEQLEAAHARVAATGDPDAAAFIAEYTRKKTARGEVVQRNRAKSRLAYRQALHSNKRSKGDSLCETPGSSQCDDYLDVEEAKDATAAEVAGALAELSREQAQLRSAVISARLAHEKHMVDVAEELAKTREAASAMDTLARAERSRLSRKTWETERSKTEFAQALIAFQTESDRLSDINAAIEEIGRKARHAEQLLEQQRVRLAELEKTRWDEMKAAEVTAQTAPVTVPVVHDTRKTRASSTAKSSR